MKRTVIEAPSLAPQRHALVRWFRAHKRTLPWRGTQDPYAVWVSEIMLQQTRVDTVTPRFARWMRRFPTVKALASAPLDDVLSEWAGLGYYARARNLHAAAREVVAKYGAQVPRDAEAVRALPGIGRYTAGAILSLAYGMREPIVDGNVIRVLTRLFAIEGDPKTPAVQSQLWALAKEFVAGGDPSDVNQGLMELGALVCTPRAPRCDECPWSRTCAAHIAGRAEEFPRASRAATVKAVTHVSIALLRAGQVLLVRRPPSGLWGGLFEFPSDELHAGEAHAHAAERVADERVGLRVIAPSPLARFDHVLSHRRVTFHAYQARAQGRVRLHGYDDHRWMKTSEAAKLGISRATRRMLDALDDST